MSNAVRISRLDNNSNIAAYGDTHGYKKGTIGSKKGALT